MSLHRTTRAHAKINLVLRILAREASGYHSIETLFQRLALHDVVEVRVTDAARTLTCDGPSMPAGGIGAPEENLAWRAAALYAAEAKWETGWHIAIEKHIPVGGGLGGGSADAAAVLRALESLCPTPIGRDALIALGGTLGADVAFFVADVSRAWAWNRGDRLLPLAPLPAMPVTLVAFTEGVHTGRAYGAFAAARETQHAPLAAHSYDAGAFDTWEALCALAANDFEQVVPAMHRGVATVLPALRDLAAAVRAPGRPACALLSGSGATCFVLHPEGTSVSPVLPAGARLVRTATM
jgi:4-diphosphocytidyl-2-C-methyl-D-erythritol kinase